MGLRVSKNISKDMVGSGIRTRQFWLPNRNEDHTFVVVKVLPALQESLRIMSNFRKRKKTPTWIFSFREKNFPRKIITLYFVYSQI